MNHFLAALFIAVPTCMLSTSVMSAAGVVEAQSFPAGQAQVAGSSNDALVMLLDQFREMRAELESLRGLVEEQGHELRLLQRESLDRYTDLDSRLSALSAATPLSQASSPALNQATISPPVSPGQTSSSAGASDFVAVSGAPLASTVNANAVPVSPPAVESPVASPAVPAVAGAIASGGATLQPTVLSEQQQYQQALDSLLQDEQYQRSVSEFDQYLTLYPAGRFVTNAYYWKGQAYLNLSMLNEARQSFEVIVNQYPDGRKVDDAMYSLGTVYDKLDDPERARQLLRQVQSRFPNTSAANLADIYLRSMN